MVIFIGSESIFLQSLLYSAIALRSQSFDRGWNFVDELNSWKQCKDLVNENKGITFVNDTPFRFITDENIKEVRKLLKENPIINLDTFSKDSRLKKVSKQLKLNCEDLPQIGRSEDEDQVRYIARCLLKYIEQMENLNA